MPITSQSWHKEHVNINEQSNLLLFVTRIQMLGRQHLLDPSVVEKFSYLIEMLQMQQKDIMVKRGIKQIYVHNILQKGRKVPL